MAASHSLLFFVAFPTRPVAYVTKNDGGLPQRSALSVAR